VQRQVLEASARADHWPHRLEVIARLQQCEIWWIKMNGG
jgi:hypothetical protein